MILQGTNKKMMLCILFFTSLLPENKNWIFQIGKK